MGRGEGSVKEGDMIEGECDKWYIDQSPLISCHICYSGRVAAKGDSNTYKQEIKSQKKVEQYSGATALLG
jgi:hypothetical protein